MEEHSMLTTSAYKVAMSPLDELDQIYYDSKVCPLTLQSVKLGHPLVTANWHEAKVELVQYTSRKVIWLDTSR
jgi:hypothetical protein